MFGETALAYTSELNGTAIPSNSNMHKSNIAFSNNSVSTQPDCEEQMPISNGTYARKFRGRYPANSSRPTTPEITDWFADKLRGLSCKEIALLAECGERTAENIKLGKCAPNAATQAALFRNHPDLGAAYMEYIGILLPGQAETAAAYTRFANAAVRMPRP